MLLGGVSSRTGRQLAIPFLGNGLDLSWMDTHRRSGMGQRRQRINMFDPAIFSIRIQGKLGESWSEYFGAQSIQVEVDEAGLSSTILISEPVDQAALIGMINHLNGLGLPVVSVECLPASAECLPASEENNPSQQDEP
jgi:hypothetical protein